MRSILLVAVLLTGAFAVPAQAQTVWSRPYEPNQIAVEGVVPERPNNNTSGLSGATFLTLTRSFTDNVELEVELPVAQSAGNGPSTTAVGNPYVGVGMSSTTRPLLLELGARLPVVPTNRARLVGQRADAGRGAAFRDEAISGSALLNGRVALSRHTSLRLRTGLSYASVQSDRTGRTGHWQIPYSAQLWRDGDQVITGLSVVGRPSLTDAPDGRQALHRAVLSLMINWDRLQPGVLLGTGLNPLVTEGRFVLLGGVTLSISYDR